MIDIFILACHEASCSSQKARPERKETKKDLDFPARIEKSCGQPKVLGLSPGSGNFLYFRSARHDP
jgi:hypothetical protein